MFGKGSRIYSIAKMKCPKCQEGQFFSHHPYDIKHAGDLLEHCPSCGMKYEKEPGFYYGAMYVSYALGVALFVTCRTSFNLFFPWIGTAWQIGIIVGVTLVTAPYLYALSKIIWANLFFSYDKKAIEQHRAKN